jgi:hypothetical protein
LKIAAGTIGVLKLIAADKDLEMVMAKVIEIYIPKNFRKPLKWIHPLESGKVIEFCLLTKKSA